MLEAQQRFNNASHYLRDDFSQAADALIQAYLDEIEKLKAAKVEVRKATDPVCGLPRLPEHDDDTNVIAARFAPAGAIAG